MGVRWVYEARYIGLGRLTGCGDYIGRGDHSFARDPLWVDEEGAHVVCLLCNRTFLWPGEASMKAVAFYGWAVREVVSGSISLVADAKIVGPLARLTLTSTAAELVRLEAPEVLVAMKNHVEQWSRSHPQVAAVEVAYGNKILLRAEVDRLAWSAT